MGVRKTLKEGVGLRTPVDGTTALLAWKVSTDNGEVLDEQEMLEYVVGSDDLGPLSRTVNRVLLDMRTGGKVRLECSGDYAWGDGTYVVEMGLREVLLIDDISPMQDKSIMKKQVVGGKGDIKPQDGDQVVVTVEGCLSQTTGKPIPGFSGRSQLKFTVGDGEVCDALEYAIVEMLPGERSILLCSRPVLCAESRVGLGDIGSIEGTVNLMVGLVKCDRCQSFSTMSDAEIFKFAGSRKEIGGKLFKAGRHGIALGRYRSAICALKNCAELSDAMSELIRVCHLNNAACLLKLNDNHGAKSACTAVLVDEPGNIKALFRRATARLELQEFDEACVDLRQLLEIDPENREAKKLFIQAVRRAKEAKTQASAMFTKMTKGLDGNIADEQERRRLEEREMVKPGQVMSIAESERQMEKAMEMAMADMERMRAEKVAREGKENESVEPSPK